MHNNDDTAKFRELYDKIETNRRSLRAIGIQADTCGCILVPMLKNKLPKEINVLLRRKFDPKKDLWEIEEIMRELRIELEARERCITEKEARQDKVHCPLHSTTEALMAVEGLKCPYCQASHFTDKCDVVMYCGPVYTKTASHTREELHCFDDLRSHKNDTLRISERFISNFACSMFEEIRRKKRIAKINVSK